MYSCKEHLRTFYNDNSYCTAWCCRKTAHVLIFCFQLASLRRMKAVAVHIRHKVVELLLYACCCHSTPPSAGRCLHRRSPQNRGLQSCMALWYRLLVLCEAPHDETNPVGSGLSTMLPPNRCIRSPLVPVLNLSSIVAPCFHIAYT